MKVKSKTRGGFTLTEIMLALSITGVLAAIALPAYTKNVVKSQVSEGVLLFQNAKAVGLDYFMQHGAFPINNTQAQLPVMTGRFVSGVVVFGNTTQYQVKVSYSSESEFQANSKINQGYLTFTGQTTSSGSVLWSCLPDGIMITSTMVPLLCNGQVFEETPASTITKTTDNAPTNNNANASSDTQGNNTSNPPAVDNNTGSTGNTTVTNPDGSIIRSDGSILYPNGDVQYPNGSIVHPDGSTTFPDGSVMLSDGTIKYPNGDIHFPDGSVSHANGSITYPDGVTIDKDGYMSLSQNQIQKYGFVNGLYSRYNNALKRYNKDVTDWTYWQNQLSIAQAQMNTFQTKIDAQKDQNKKNDIINSGSYNQVKQTLNQANSNIINLKNDIPAALQEIQNSINDYNNSLQDYLRNKAPDGILPSDYPRRPVLPKSILS